MALTQTVRTVVASMALALAAVPAATAADAVRMTTQEWSPYQVLENGTLGGHAVAAVQCVMESIDTPYTIDVLPWARAQLLVEEGQADAFFAASASAKRDAYATLSDSIAPQVWRWYHLKDNAVDIGNKENLAVGVQLGSNMASWLDSNDYKAVTKLPQSGDLIRVLKAGRVEAVLSNELAFEDDLAAVGESLDQFSSVEHSNRPLAVYFSNTFLAANPGFLDKFNAAVPSCARS